ncbi:hypothetical protein [Porphyromonas catoniae]|uniref:nuclear transport factor 2 family protein n=1 Tax=Porphyromonas catoniae TaxID=41976 RepID=UPI0028D54A07|nr:hypothetical protein [Porphyromonas catoniae]
MTQPTIQRYPFNSPQPSVSKPSPSPSSARRQRKVLDEGNFVLAISEGSFGGKAVTFYDLFRVEGGKIAEHWDVVDPVLPTEQHQNKNGKFGF